MERSKMPTVRALILAIVAAWPLYSTHAAELQLLHRHGTPIEDRDQAWSGRVDYASWVDDEHVVFGTIDGTIACLSLTTKELKWSREKVGEIRNWSFSPGTKRVALQTADKMMRDKSVDVIDATNGKTLFAADNGQLAKLLQVDHALPSRLAIAPNDGRLFVCLFSTFYGRNVYVLDPKYQKVVAMVPIDASPQEMSLSPKGDRLAAIADNSVLCVRDLSQERDVFYRGNRVDKEPESFTAAIDAPFFSHLQDGGKDWIVYSRDNSWSTGQIFVHNLTTKKTHEFDAGNGHIEMDVSFSNRRIALTGTSTDLTVVDFDGKVISQKKKATLQRNMCVSFSPHGDKLVVGSWDNTVSVFKFAD